MIKTFGMIFTKGLFYAYLMSDKKFQFRYE